MVLFPHDIIRPIQDEMIRLIDEQVKIGGHAIIHAPTGLGKTAASIAPVIRQALDQGKTIFFLTPRNTQHRIAIDTVRAIKGKYNIDIRGTDIVGKKWMCIQPGVTMLATNEFNEYCRALREDKKCSFYEDLKSGEKLTPKTQMALAELNQISPTHIEDVVDIGTQHKLCPYELAQLLSEKAHIIVTDYYYLFHPKIRENFLSKNKKKLEDAIIIVDEAHNLPSRIKDLATENLSTRILKRATTEAKKFNKDNLAAIFERLAIAIRALCPYEEAYLSRDKLINIISNIEDYNNLMEECYNIADDIREEQKVSSIGSIATFMDAWIGSDNGYTRIISKKGDDVDISYRCLDPSVISKEVVDNAHSVILMSGTLTPTKMYAELLGFSQESLQKTFPSPFPEKNRLNMIIAKTSTKFTGRSDKQFKEIAKILTEVINVTPGNSAIFFPSYHFKDQVAIYMAGVEKTVFQEYQQMSKVEKDEMIEKYKTYKKTGATLLAVVSGSYGEGVDLPGDELKTVVVVGLPLGKPDLETKALIEYYDKKFKKGWDYGYVYPAFNKIIQSAGRCIRSETDKGVIIFLDERFTWPRYYRCFPKTWKIKVNVNRYKEQIIKFFNS